jgi:integrase/recombinase XerD
MLRDVFRRAGVYQKGFPLTHWIRHSVGSQMLLGGVDLETVRDILGHADITTTALYLHGTEKAKRDATKALPW